MPTQKEILQEIKELKFILSKLIGSADLEPENQFSLETLDKAAKQFQKLSIERGEWIKEEDITKYIRKAPYRPGDFIRTEFKFANYFKRGREYFYSKKDIISLGEKLKERNIDLGRYEELLRDKANFEKKLALLAMEQKESPKKKPYQIPIGLKDITTSPIPPPSPDIIKEDIARLKEEFFQFKLSDYIDIYKNNHAMMKSIYYF